MDYSNRTWIILNVSDITDEMIENSIESSVDDLRKTNDGVKTFLKFEGNTPSCFDGITTYTYSEILEELSTSDWVTSDNIG